MPQTSLTARTLRIVVVRIGLVAAAGSLMSYLVNHGIVETGIREQLVLSAEQTLQRESLPFRELIDLQRNFLNEFADLYSSPGAGKTLTADFEQVFYRHDDGSYTQRPGIFEGQPLPDGRRFRKMSATYAPDIPPDDDIKARLMLSFTLSYKFGSSADGRLFNIYGVVPEKGFPIYQDADIGKVFTYGGPDALKLEEYEFYSRGLAATESRPFFTKMYWDFSNNAWMTTVATPDPPDAAGRHRIIACVDVLLDQLMNRVAKPALQGAYASIFLPDNNGTLIFHKDYVEDIKKSEGAASIRGLNDTNDLAVLDLARTLPSSQVKLVETTDEIVAVGLLPETPWALSLHYPKVLMQPSILQNLAVVIVLGLLTLLVEIYILRSVLHHQVTVPLGRLMRATRMIGLSDMEGAKAALPVDARDEIGALARDFHTMATRIDEAHHLLEEKVQDRTAALETANLKLKILSTTDALTAVANRRHFIDTLESEWRRAQRSGQRLFLAMIDVDHFKAYNDHYGHLAGDACLRRIADIISSHLKRAGDLFARYGGEEFALLLTHGDGSGAHHFVESIGRAVVAAGIPHEKSDYGCVTISIGLAALVPDADHTAMELIRRADNALYRSKNDGRNRVTVSA